MWPEDRTVYFTIADTILHIATEFYLGLKFGGGGSLSIIHAVNDCSTQDMHVDLMHVLYVYSRVMRRGVITKYSRWGGQVYVVSLL